MLAVALTMPYGLANGAEPGVSAPRSKAVIRAFRAENPCPATGKTTGACPGWQVDHREALVCGGTDTVENLQWLAVAEHREKTRAEVKLCRPDPRTKYHPDTKGSHGPSDQSD